MKNQIKILCSITITLGFIFIALASGNNDGKMSNKEVESGEVTNEKYINYDLTKIKKGNILVFQNQCRDGCDKIILEFLESNKVKLKLDHVWDKTVGSNTIKMKEYYEGIYDYSFVETKDLKFANDYWAFYNKGILLSNDNYGFDKGFLYLSKKYIISNIEDRKDPKIKSAPTIYSWLDPINYPSRNEEFDELGIILNEVK
jgi:hypothetical protein